MKWKKFKAKKSMDKLHKIYAERDSVCMGDDCNAPNARSNENLNSTCTLKNDLYDDFEE